MQNEILVVDDDINLLDLICEILKLYNYTCDTAENGMKAFEMVKNKFYNLVISDIKMPVMNGTELLKSIRFYQSADIKKSKVILMTAYSTGELVDDADRLGVDEFLMKPFDITFFIERIDQILNSSTN